MAHGLRVRASIHRLFSAPRFDRCPALEGRGVMHSPGRRHDQGRVLLTCQVCVKERRVLLKILSLITKNRQIL
jgi:hypothetical protein